MCSGWIRPCEPIRSHWWSIKVYIVVWDAAQLEKFPLLYLSNFLKTWLETWKVCNVSCLPFVFMPSMHFGKCTLPTLCEIFSTIPWCWASKYQCCAKVRVNISCSQIHIALISLQVSHFDYLIKLGRKRKTCMQKFLVDHLLSIILTYRLLINHNIG